MAKLDRKKSGAYTARKVIPADVRAEYRALYGRGHEEIFSAPATDNPQRAQVKCSEWLADIGNRIATLRAKKRGDGRDLTQREARALAGEWYLWFLSKHEEPGEPSHWTELHDVLTDAAIHATPEWNAYDPLVDQLERGKQPEVREAIQPMLADEAKTAQFLASKGEVLTPDAMVAFLDHLVSHFLSACSVLERRARCDYTADTRPESFPGFNRRKP